MAWRQLGKRCVVLVHRLDEILAQTDPFDLAQAVERHVRTLDGGGIRSLLLSARDRMNVYYRDELSQLVDEPLQDDQLRTAFTRFLKSNLRAIGLFGPAFSGAVLDECPAHRVVAIGEERRAHGTRAAMIGAVALALVVLGAAGEHAVSNARANAQGPAQADPPPVAPALSYSTPAPAMRRAAHVQPQPTRAPAPPPEHVAATHQAVAVPADPRPRGSAAPASAYVPAGAPPVLDKPRRNPGQRTPEPGRTAIVVNATTAPPTPEPTPIDVSDMPDATNNATPMPEVSAASAEVPDGMKIVKPKPSPKPKNWLHRTLMHFDPFQPGAHVRIP